MLVGGQTLNKTTVKASDRSRQGQRDSWMTWHGLQYRQKNIKQSAMEKQWEARDRERTRVMMGKELNKGRGSAGGITEMRKSL